MKLQLSLGQLLPTGIKAQLRMKLQLSLTADTNLYKGTAAYEAPTVAMTAELRYINVVLFFSAVVRGLLLLLEQNK